MKQNVMVVTNKKELLVAFKKSYFFDGETRIILHHKNGTTEYKIYCPLKCFEKAFKRVLRKINRTHSKYFI